MKRRILSMLLLAALVIGLLPQGILSVSADDSMVISYPVEGGNLYFEKATGTIADCDDTVTAADIPTQIDGVAVTSIGDNAFRDCNTLQSVTLPDGLKSIGYGAFWECSGLTSVVIPGSVEYMDGSAFRSCFNLESVTIMDGVIAIGDEAFAGCNSLTSVAIPNSVRAIGPYAFSCCHSLTMINVAEGNIDYCSENGVLFDKDKTVLIAYPTGRTESEYHIPNGVKEICNDAFYYCGSLTSVTIPDGVTVIGESAFCGCINLTNITIPEGVTSIGWFAFMCCQSLASVSIPDSMTSIGRSAFVDTEIYNAEERWTDGVLYIDNWLIEAEDSITGDYVIPIGTVGIADCAFWECGSLTSVTIPEGVTSISDGAFCYCSSLTSVTIPEGVANIGDCAFSYCSSLTSVMIPEGVTSIGDYAFESCTSLQSVYFKGDAPELGFAVFQIPMDEDILWDYANIPGLVLYYIEGKEGWTNPTWNGYPTTTWKAEELTPPVEFADVETNAWYVEAVQYAVEKGLMNGVGGGKFDPEGTMTRAMLVTVLWRYEGKPEAGANPFTDVPDGTWYTDAVAWAAENGIVGGIGNNKFDPEGSITREQMATILFRYAQKKGVDTSKRGELSGFPDSGAVSSWAKDAVQWTVAEKIINGSDGKLLPQGNATRAQVAAILMRFLENTVKT